MSYDGKIVIKWSKREKDVVIHYPRKADGPARQSTGLMAF